MNYQKNGEEGYFLRCDSTTKLYLEKKNDELPPRERFIKKKLNGDCLFVRLDKEREIRRIVDEWVDLNNTPKNKEEEEWNKKKQGGRGKK